MYSQNANNDCTKLRIFFCTVKNGCTNQRIQNCTVSLAKEDAAYGMMPLQKEKSMKKYQKYYLHGFFNSQFMQS